MSILCIFELLSIILFINYYQMVQIIVSDLRNLTFFVGERDTLANSRT